MVENIVISFDSLIADKRQRDIDRFDNSLIADKRQRDIDRFIDIVSY
jgi:hypothetical protein